MCHPEVLPGTRTPEVTREEVLIPVGPGESMPAMLATLTMAPPCARIQASTTNLVSTNGPRRLTSNVLSQAPSSTSSIGPKCGLVPALFTRMSMRPKRSITRLTSRCESSARPTCATIGVTAPA